MIHYMKLNPFAFYQMKCGEKTIELRLNDKKRQNINADDIIEFSNTLNPNETLHVKIIKVHNFENFTELYKSLPLNKCGYSLEQLHIASPKDMEEYYSITDQNKYGVLGIEVELINM
ncbi:MAG: RNA-binding protein [Clostridia bacterium]|nr:RNA-binding protein [Clostridia bacterium]